MADVTIAAYDGTTDNGNVQNLGSNAVMPAANGLLGTGAALTAAQTFSIAVNGNDDIVLTLEDTSGGANHITLDAGDNPPSPLAGLGAATVTMVLSDVIMYVPQKGRHIQSDGTITGSMAAAGKIWAFRMPAGFVGIAPTNSASIPAAPTD